MSALRQIFHLYWNHHLPVAHVDALNLVVLGSLALIALVTAKWQSSELLDRTQTEQLRGAACLLVIVGHLWGHVVGTHPSFSFTADAVGVFLILSGFGLTRSMHGSRPPFFYFLTRRVKRLMLPYWAATVLLIGLDYLLLGWKNSPRTLISTALGFNVTDETTIIDFARWYVTFILIWYGLFYLAMLAEEKLRMNAVALLALGGAGLMCVDTWYTDWGWYGFMAFPAGCFLGRYHEGVLAAFRKNPWRFVLGGAVILLVSLLRRTEIWQAWVVAPLPNMGRVIVREAFITGVALAFIAIAGGIARAGYASRFLLFAGAISYELYLLHGAFLIKYNPCFALLAPNLLPITFLMLLAFLFMISYGLNRLCTAKQGLKRQSS